MKRSRHYDRWRSLRAATDTRSAGAEMYVLRLNGFCDGFSSSCSGGPPCPPSAVCKADGVEIVLVDGCFHSLVAKCYHYASNTE